MKEVSVYIIKIYTEIYYRSIVMYVTQIISYSGRLITDEQLSRA